MYALAPTSRANNSALAKSVSATATTLQEGLFLYESRCQRPIWPQPMTPIRTVLLWLSPNKGGRERSDVTLTEVSPAEDVSAPVWAILSMLLEIIVTTRSTSCFVQLSSMNIQIRSCNN